MTDFPSSEPTLNGRFAVLRREKSNRFVIDFDYGDTNCSYWETYEEARDEMSRLLTEGYIVRLEDRAQPTERKPSLAEVLAFTVLEHPQEVARVERSAANRMASIRGWVGWRVSNVRLVDDADELQRLTIVAEPVGAGYREGPVAFEFLVDKYGARRSERLDAFFRACGIRDRIDDTREIDGRFFATTNRGRSAGDFGPLTHALVS